MPRFVDSIEAYDRQNTKKNVRSQGADEMKIVIDITRRGSLWTLPLSICSQRLSQSPS